MAETPMHPDVASEQWRPVAGFPDYEVSDLGRVRRTTKLGGYAAGRINRPRPNAKGYLALDLKGENGRKGWLVHRLVAAAFLPPQKPGQQINHINGVKADNRASNLEWCSPSENVLHAWNTGLKTVTPTPPNEARRGAKLTPEAVRQIRALRASGLSAYLIGKAVCVPPSTVHAVLDGRTWGHVV